MWNGQEVIKQVEADLKLKVFPGAEFSVLDQGKKSHFLFGYAQHFPAPEKLVSKKMWDLASVTKVVGTGTVLIDLILGGKIKLDQSIKTYLPEFSNETVTVRECLTHTSGIDPYIEHRDQLTFSELKQAILNISVSTDKTFRYTDVNFILLGFLLEHYFQASLDEIFKKTVFERWHMTHIAFGPVDNAVVTSQQIACGHVHDPKAQVLGVECGSAGLFSDLETLERFVEGYFSDDKYLQLVKNYARGHKKRSLAWDILEKDDHWLLHTGYTGTFILLNLVEKKAVIFLSNRVYFKDDRAQWIKDRDDLIALFVKGFEK